MIFTPKAEKFTVWMPFFWLPLIVIERFHFHNFTGVEISAARFITSSLFFSNLHIIFTFIMLAFLPEMQQWIRASEPKGEKNFWLNILLVYFLFFSITFLSDSHLVDSKFLSLSALSFILVFNLNHTLWQFYGISRLFDRLHNSNPYVHIERKLIHFFFWLVAIRLTRTIFILGGLYKPDEFSQLDQIINKSFFYTSFILAITLVGFSLKNHFQFKNNKLLYSLRYILLAWLPDLFSVQVALAAMHGTESLFVFQSIVNKSQISSEKRQRIYSLTAGACGLGLMILTIRKREGLISPLFMPYAEVPAIIRVIGCAYLAVAVTHFYLDKKIFNSRLVQSKKIIEPLFNMNA